MTSQQEMDEIRARFWAAAQVEAHDKVQEALDNVAQARRELDHIEAQLRHAARGEAYERIGCVWGVNADKVFSAFGAVERAAMPNLMTDF